MYRIGFIGTGVVGSALALVLKDKGYNITAVCSKTGISAAKLAQKLDCRCAACPEEVLDEADVVFLTVPDRELPFLAGKLAGSAKVTTGHIFYHVSGAAPAEVLNPLKERGAAAGSIHPLQTFAGVDKAIENLPGSFFALQGDDRANQLAFEFVRDLEGTPFPIRSADKALYHMGACIASNYLVSLVHCAVKIYQSIGMSEEQATAALLPLIRGTLANIEEMGPVKSLTGPVARGDTVTVEKHLEAVNGQLQEQSENYRGMRQVYTTLGRYTAGVALAKGSIDKQKAEEISRIFREEEGSGG